MGPTLALLLLLALAAGLFYGGRSLRRSRDGSRRLAGLVGSHDKVAAALILVGAAALVALGLWALVLAL